MRTVPPLRRPTGAAQGGAGRLAVPATAFVAQLLAQLRRAGSAPRVMRQDPFAGPMPGTFVGSMGTGNAPSREQFSNSQFAERCVHHRHCHQIGRPPICGAPFHPITTATAECCSSHHSTSPLLTDGHGTHQTAGCSTAAGGGGGARGGLPRRFPPARTKGCPQPAWLGALPCCGAGEWMQMEDGWVGSSPASGGKPVDVDMRQPSSGRQLACHAHACRGSGCLLAYHAPHPWPAMLKLLFRLPTMTRQRWLTSLAAAPWR